MKKGVEVRYVPYYLETDEFGDCKDCGNPISEMTVRKPCKVGKECDSCRNETEEECKCVLRERDVEYRYCEYCWLVECC
jgi:hypothetical protein